MNKYEAQARTQAAAYAAGRKKQTEAELAQINATAATQSQAVSDETTAAVQERQSTLLDTLDNAEVERRIALGQARETVARLGLSGSGLARASATAAEAAARRRTQTAQSAHREAVTALTEEQERRLQELEQERTAAVQTAQQSETDDVARQTNALLEAAYKAEATETAAATKAAQQAAEADARAKQSAAKAKESAARSQASAAESTRRTALREMLKQGQIHSEIYIDALQNGWSVSETRRRQTAWTAWRKQSGTLVAAYQRDGYEGLLTRLASCTLTDRQWEDLCFELALDEDTVRADLKKRRGATK